MTSLLNIAGNIPVSAAAVGGQSLRFEDGDSPSFSFTFGTPTNQIKWTMSFWCKRGEIGREHAIYGAANGGGETFFVAFYPDDIEAYISNGRNHVTNAVFRDPSAWYHIVQVFDSANSTADDRFITYVNGVRQTTSTNSVALNDTTAWNSSGVTGYFGKNYAAWFGDSRDHFDGYLANVTFIDGQALTPTSFGEYDDTLWKPKSDTDIQALTFGTNGFYLPFKQTTVAEGFSTVTYTGNGGTHSIEGVGFEPDFVWLKNRTDASTSHTLFDSVRGAGKMLQSDSTSSEASNSQYGYLSSFDSSGFTLTNGSTNANYVNVSGKNYVAWCWDAGSGSAVSNTDGATTSNVKANTDKGFSICTWTVGSENSTVGHGLNSAPEVILMKSRSYALGWAVQHTGLTNMTDRVLALNTTSAEITAGTSWSAPTSTTFGTSSALVISGETWVGYCFHSVSGYSSFGSYTGTGATGNSITGLGFEPAWLMIKRYDGGTNGWMIYDNTRDVDDDRTARLKANAADAEDTGDAVSFDSDGFTLNATGASVNGSSNDYIYMAFADTRDATFFGDTSGNSNNWTPNALNNTDVVPDSPVTGGNFATLNPLDAAGISSNFYLHEGNLAYSVTNNSSYRNVSSTFFPEGLKGYYEFSVTTGTPNFYVGMYPATSNPSASLYTATNTIQLAYNGTLYNGSTTLISSMLSSFSAGDVGMVAFDFTGSSKYIWFGKNGSWGVDGSSNTQDPAGGNNPAHTFTTEQQLYFASNTGSGTQTIVVNFGQDSSFAGTETPQGNTDDNGVGDFYYAPPSGFLALTTGNLPAPTITAPDEYFNTVLWAGNNTTGHAITGVNFQSDWTWIKLRNGASGHRLVDAVRGVTKYLDSSGTAAETTNTDRVTSFDSDGFTLGNSATVNGSFNYVAWNWLSGNGTVSNTDGTITSTVSANTDAGFSIVKYVGNQVSGSTIGHGLSQAPQITFHKNLDTARNWESYFINPSDGSYDYIYLNMTNGKGDMSISAPSASVITLSGSQDSNKSGDEHIAYCFHSVEGYSKIGTYTGNGSSDGTFVHTGFAVSWVMAKRTDSTSDWWIWDFTRADNENFANIYANSSYGENTSTSVHEIDLLSNGFKLRDTAYSNVSGGSYIFLAFAEAPFSKSNAR